MPALGQKRTSDEVNMMSALPPKADIRRCNRHVRFVPKADIGSELSREPGGDLAQRRSRPILSLARWRSDVNEPRYALVRCQAESIEHAAIIGVPAGDPARPISERMRCEDKVHSSSSRG